MDAPAGRPRSRRARRARGRTPPADPDRRRRPGRSSPGRAPASGAIRLRYRPPARPRPAAPRRRWPGAAAPGSARTPGRAARRPPPAFALARHRSAASPRVPLPAGFYSAGPRRRYALRRARPGAIIRSVSEGSACPPSRDDGRRRPAPALRRPVVHRPRLPAGAPRRLERGRDAHGLRRLVARGALLGVLPGLRPRPRSGGARRPPGSLRLPDLRRRARPAPAPGFGRVEEAPGLARPDRPLDPLASGPGPQLLGWRLVLGLAGALRAQPLLPRPARGWRDLPRLLPPCPAAAHEPPGRALPGHRGGALPGLSGRDLPAGHPGVPSRLAAGGTVRAGAGAAGGDRGGPLDAEPDVRGERHLPLDQAALRLLRPDRPGLLPRGRRAGRFPAPSARVHLPGGGDRDALLRRPV